jgi:hypothetical protein
VKIAKGAAGFLFGLLVWWALSAPYARLLAFLAEPLLRLGERPPVTRLIANERELTVDRSDFPRASPRPGLRLADLTANLILLTTFFAVSRRPWNDRNVRGLAVSGLLLVAVHVAAVVVNVESIYALRLGPWSAVHYGAVSRNVWAAAAHFYSVVGIFGAPFALWWLFRPPEDPVHAMAGTGRTKRNRK